MNYFPFKNNINQPYIFPLSLTDPDGDSISVEPAKPLQDKGTPVSNYFVPANYDGDKVVSRLQLHTPSNEIIWANPLEEDEYNYAVKIREWRYNHSENTWTEMGYTLFDFQMIFLDRLGGPPVIRQLKDTVVLFSNSFEEEITILDDNTDSMKVWISGNLPETIELKTTIDQDIYYPTPLQEVISVTNTADLLAPGPYKIVVSMNPKQYHSTSSQKSAMLWVTDHTGRPDAPSGLKVDRALNNKIIISWQDQSGDEAGYSIDRADSYFPEFIRIAALPENSIQYIDENVIPNRDYYYRVRAMGTEGSADSEILEVKEQDIITGMDDFSTDSGIILYPIPAGDQLFIRTDGIIQWPAVIVVLDLNGRILQRTALGYSMNSTPIVIPIGELIPGLYFLQITSAEFTFRQKFVKNK